MTYRFSFLALLLASSVLAAPALTPPAAVPTTPAPAASVPPTDDLATLPPANTAAINPNRTLSLKTLGANQPLSLRGDSSPVGVGFGVRMDETVTRANLRLQYTYSPAMLPDLSHLAVMLNEQVVAVAPMPKSHAGTLVTQNIALDPRFFSDYNQLQFRLIGHYTNDCEDPSHSSLWAQVSNLSRLELTTQPLILSNDLGFLPEPFFDRRDFNRLVLPFVFARTPSSATLTTAGKVASWFGAKASWRGARFPVSQADAPPDRHAIVFASATERPSWLANRPPVTVPTLTVMAHPTKPEVKFLLVEGKDAAQLNLAAEALMLGKSALSGSRATVTSITLPQPRQPYDAPSWVRLDRPTRFSELIDSPRELQVAGRTPNAIRLNLRVPADLMTWQSKGIRLDLKYRYPPPQNTSESRLNVSINDDFLQSFFLQPAGNSSSRPRIPLLEDGLFHDSNAVKVPAFKVGSRNQLQFAFSFVAEKAGRCTTALVDNTRAAIDPDSTVDFSGYPHFATLPNLAFFANSGYPFTRLADLAETVVVLPDAPAPQAIETYLSLMGRMGESTGYPALRLRLATVGTVSQTPDADLLFIDTALPAAAARLPALIKAAEHQLAQASREQKQVYENNSPPDADAARAQGQAVVMADGVLAALVGMASPLSPTRSAVFVMGSSPAALPTVLDALENPARAANIRGSIAFVRQDKVDSTLVGDTYTVGNVSFVVRAWIRLSEHPIGLAVLTVLAVLVFAFALLRAVKAVALRRLERQGKA